MLCTWWPCELVRWEWHESLLHELFTYILTYTPWQSSVKCWCKNWTDFITTAVRFPVICMSQLMTYPVPGSLSSMLTNLHFPDTLCFTVADSMCFPTHPSCWPNHPLFGWYLCWDHCHGLREEQCSRTILHLTSPRHISCKKIAVWLFELEIIKHLALKHV